MRFTDEVVASLHVTDSNDAALGVVEGVYAGARSGLFGTEVSLISLAQGGVRQRHAPHPLQQVRLAGHGGAILLTNYAHCTVAISTPGQSRTPVTKAGSQQPEVAGQSEKPAGRSA